MKVSRRFVLHGLGATVALPVLPSLLTASEAKAQAAMNRRCFVSIATNHGGIWARNMFQAAPASATSQTYAGRTIKSWALTADRTTTPGTAIISPTLRAADAGLPDSLLAKMLVIQGLDIPFYIGHNTGGPLGNFARNDGNGDDGKLAQTNANRRTVDQIMAWSQSFYGDAASVKERVMVLSGRASYNWANPADSTSPLQEITASAGTPLQLFTKLFPMTGPAVRPPIVDRVLESYNTLRSSSRLSVADKRRLDDHIQRLHELERRLKSTVMCTGVTAPTGPLANVSMGSVIYNAPYAHDPMQHASYFELYNDVITLALSCQVSRLATIRIDPLFSTYAGDWHQEVAHQSGAIDGVKQTVLYESHQKIFEGVLVDLARKLDAVDTGDGKKLLDHSLVAWTQESGNVTHENQSMPVIAFGGAGGYFKGGLHLDLRNPALVFQASETEARRPGLLWQQWLGNVLAAMGVPRTEWEKPATNLGYPDYNYSKVNFVPLTTAQAYPPEVWSAAGEKLPIVTT